MREVFAIERPALRRVSAGAIDKALRPIDELALDFVSAGADGNVSAVDDNPPHAGRCSFVN